MKFTANYHILDISYEDISRVTTVRIVCEDTGEVFEGNAIRNPKDGMDIRLGANIALTRAVKEMVDTNIKDDLDNLIEYGELPFDHC